MMRSMYAKRDVTKYYFTLPNQIFDLGLHYIEVAIYAYALPVDAPEVEEKKVVNF